MKKKENIEKPLLTSPKGRDRKREQSQFVAPKGRQASAQCEALCKDATTNPIDPRSNIVQNDSLAWGKIEEKENRSQSSQYRKNGSLFTPRINSKCLSEFVSESLANNMRFLSVVEITTKNNIQYSINNNQYRSWETSRFDKATRDGSAAFASLPEESCRKHPSAFGISPTPPLCSSPKGTFEERKGRIEKREQSQFSAPTGRKITARGNALGLNMYIISIAPRSNIVQDDRVAWGKTEEKENRSLFSKYTKNGSVFTPEINSKRHSEFVSESLTNNMRFLSVFGMTTKNNIQYSINNNQCRSWEREESRSDQSQSQFVAPKGRQASAQCEALCKDATTNNIAPRLYIVQNDTIAWGKTTSMRSAHLKNGHKSICQWTDVEYKNIYLN
jgi:hypothetical protein